MERHSGEWEERVARVWDEMDRFAPDEFVAQMDALAAERAEEDAVALFERASARDSTGHSDQAVPLYRQALQEGLPGSQRRRATIQLASSLRNLDQAAESVALLEAEREQPSDELDDALAVFLALSLADMRREREGLALALATLAPHLPRYQRSVKNYAQQLAQAVEAPNAGLTTGMTQAADTALRAHLRALLTAPQAHVTLDDVLEDFPVERLHERVSSLPYSAWELLWHLRFAQRDILDFVRDKTYSEPEWPAAYWPDRSAKASAQDWDAQAQAFRDDLAALLALLDDPAVDLLAVVPNGKDQTWLREFLLVADHTAYHAGQLRVLRRLLAAAE